MQTRYYGQAVNCNRKPGEKEAVMKKPHSLIFWINMLSVIFPACSTAVLAVFAKISMDSLLEQEIENRRGFLRMEADNVDGNLDALERYLYQAFNDSEELVCIETSLDETKRFMAIQGVSSTLYKIANWNTSLELLFFYSPDSPVETAIRTSSASGDYAERETYILPECELRSCFLFEPSAPWRLFRK